MATSGGERAGPSDRAGCGRARDIRSAALFPELSRTDVTWRVAWNAADARPGRSRGPPAGGPRRHGPGRTHVHHGERLRDVITGQIDQLRRVDRRCGGAPSAVGAAVREVISAVRSPSVLDGAVADACHGLGVRRPCGRGRPGAACPGRGSPAWWRGALGVRTMTWRCAGGARPARRAAGQRPRRTSRRGSGSTAERPGRRNRTFRRGQTGQNSRTERRVTPRRPY